MALPYFEVFISRYQTEFSAIGITVVFLILLKFIWIILEGYRLFILPRFQQKDLKQYGKWAVVTGCTDGIGKSYARQLAKRKIDLILISRNNDKLTATAEEIEKEFNVTVKTIQADFCNGWELCRTIEGQLADEDIGILVNNVGLMAPHPCYFLDLTQEDILDTINVNACSLLLMTTIVLPRMLERKTGVIVNVTSIISKHVAPLISCYGACKCLVSHLSLALYWENKYSGVYVQTLLTSCVTTKMINFTNVFKYLRPFVTDPDTYSESALGMLGQTSVSTGYWGHSIQLLFTITSKTFQKYVLFGVNLLFVRSKSR